MNSGCLSGRQAWHFWDWLKKKKEKLLQSLANYMQLFFHSKSEGRASILCKHRPWSSRTEQKAIPASCSASEVRTQPGQPPTQRMGPPPLMALPRSSPEPAGPSFSSFLQPPAPSSRTSHGRKSKQDTEGSRRGEELWGWDCQPAN